jgi:integrase
MEKKMNKRKTSRQKYLTEEEYKRFLDSIRGDRDYLLFLLCGNLGLRVGELVRLRVADLIQEDTQEFYLHAPTLKRGSKKGVRTGSLKRGCLPKAYEDLPISKDVVDLVLKYINKHKIKDWLFPYKDSHIPEYSVARYFKFYAKKAGLDSSYSIHALRHFRGFQIYKYRGDLKAVQALLRHKSIKTTSIYAELNLGSKRRVVEGIKTIK